MRRAPSDPAADSPPRPRGADPTFAVIGARLLGGIALVAALAIGQWARTSVPMSKGGPESRTLFGLTSARTPAIAGPPAQPELAFDYAAPPATVDASAASTSRWLGLLLGGLVGIAALLAFASLGHVNTRPALGRLASLAGLIAFVAAVIGLVFAKSGLVSMLRDAGRAREMLGVGAASSGPGSSFYAVVLAVLLLAIAEARMRVASVDGARKDRRRTARRART
jgi:hypothetical protein